MPTYTYELFDGDDTLLNSFTSDYDLQAVRTRFYGDLPPGIRPDTSVTGEVRSDPVTKVPIYQSPQYEDWNPPNPPGVAPENPQEEPFIRNYYLWPRAEFVRRLRVTDSNGNVIVDGEPGVTFRRETSPADGIEQGELVFSYHNGLPSNVDLPGEVSPRDDAPYSRPWQN